MFCHLVEHLVHGHSLVAVESLTRVIETAGEFNHDSTDDSLIMDVDTDFREK